MQLDLWPYAHLCILCVSVIEFFPLSFLCGHPLFFSTISECYTLCFHSYLASQGSLGPLRWSAVSPVLRAQGPRHFPIFKPAAVREHMSNSWMTHVTSAEAGRSSEELQLDSGWVNERTKHNPQEYNDKHLEIFIFGVVEDTYIITKVIFVLKMLYQRA